MTAPPPKERLLREIAEARSKWAPRPADVVPEPAGAGEESVWDYPRPPAIRPASDRISVRFNGREIAASERAVKVVETAGAPVYYFPPNDVDRNALSPTDRYSVCEWKGAAVYFDVIVAGARADNAAFSYPDPFDDLSEGYSAIADWVSFYPSRVDCFVGEEQASAQPGGLYAGWVTRAIKGPIKGAPGSGHW